MEFKKTLCAHISCSLLLVINCLSTYYILLQRAARRSYLDMVARRSHLDIVWKIYPFMKSRNNSLHEISRPRYQHCLDRIVAYTLSKRVLCGDRVLPRSVFIWRALFGSRGFFERQRVLSRTFFIPIAVFRRKGYFMIIWKEIRILWKVRKVLHILNTLNINTFIFILPPCLNLNIRSLSNLTKIGVSMF